MALSTALLALVLVAGKVDLIEPKTLPRTAPSSWASDGWEEFRWGMGPGDVFARAKLTPGSRIEETATPEEARYHAILDRELFGRTLAVEFAFLDGRLAGVRVTDSPLTIEEPLTESWIKKMRRALDQRYGSGACGGATPIRCAWISAGTRIELFEFPVQGGMAAYLTYADRAKGLHFEEIDRTERHKL